MVDMLIDNGVYKPARTNKHDCGAHLLRMYAPDNILKVMANQCWQYEC